MDDQNQSGFKASRPRIESGSLPLVNIDVGRTVMAGSSAITSAVFTHRGRAVHYRHIRVPVGFMDKFLVTEHARIELCRPCPVHMKCWSCPGQNSGYAAYNDRSYSYCLLYLLWTDTDTSMNCSDPYDIVLDAYRTVGSYATHYGRLLESRLNGKEMIDGRCSVCRVCTAAQSPAQPCAFPDAMRSSLEALGVNVVKLSRDVFNHPLLWYRNGGKVPKYVSVIHGLLTNAGEPSEMIMDPDVSRNAASWLDTWISSAGDH